MDIIESFSIPREAARELVYFIRTLIRNNLKRTAINNGKQKRKELLYIIFKVADSNNYPPMLGLLPSTVLFQDTLERRLAKKTKVTSHQYDICPNGCKLYQKLDQDTLECEHCGKARYTGQDLKPVKQMKIMSVGDRVASFLANNDMRDLMKYRHNYQHEVGVYKDYFDGQEYRSLLNTTDLFSSEDDVAMALFYDGFQPSHAGSGNHLGIIHLLNLNIPPEYR